MKNVEAVNETQIRDFATKNFVGGDLIIVGDAKIFMDDLKKRFPNAKIEVVKADDLDLAVGAPLTAAMQQRGLEELAKHRTLYAFDGEIPQHQPYTYGVDYNLGDLVEERSPDGFISQLIVTEQIFVSDSSGELSYPTLTLKELLLPGTWVARPIAEHWADVPDDQVWANQP